MRVLFASKEHMQFNEKIMPLYNRFERTNGRKSPTELLNSKWSPEKIGIDCRQ